MSRDKGETIERQAEEPSPARRLGTETIRRIGGQLHRITPVMDTTGKVVHLVVSPLMVELRRRDLMQIIVGASILAVPVGFTEETWNLGERLPLANILGLGLLSIVFLGSFVYFNTYRNQLRDYVWEFVKRVAAIYLLALFVVGLVLTLIGQAPWSTDALLAVKRVVIVGFPASMSAAVSDMLR